MKKTLIVAMVLIATVNTKAQEKIKGKNSNISSSFLKILVLVQ